MPASTKVWDVCDFGAVRGTQLWVYGGKDSLAAPEGVVPGITEFTVFGE